MGSEYHAYTMRPHEVGDALQILRLNDWEVRAEPMPGFYSLTSREDETCWLLLSAGDWEPCLVLPAAMAGEKEGRLYSIGVEAAGRCGDSLAWEAVTTLAAEFGGIAYDPQSEQYDGPEGAVISPPVKGREFTSVALQWIAPLDSYPSVGMRKVLDAIVEAAPEARPKLYGAYEPPTKAYVGSDEQIAHMDDLARELLVLLAGDWPLVSGDVGAGGFYPYWTINLILDATPYINAPSKQARLRRLIREVGAVSHAFFGCAELIASCSIEGKTLEFNNERPVNLTGAKTGWGGLPRRGLPWAWYGKPYAEMLGGVPEQYVASKTESGMLCTWSHSLAFADNIVGYNEGIDDEWIRPHMAEAARKTPRIPHGVPVKQRRA